MKELLSIHSAPAQHWVGDGFPVHSVFGYTGAEVAQRSPFLLLDYVAPCEFAVNLGQRRGVGAHPHRGFETVTIVFDGEVEHRDSTGAGGVIGPGDVQWMTAGGGIVHEEFHSTAYSRQGGLFEMVQLWVNLPAQAKMTPAGYQGIAAERIPNVRLTGGTGKVRLIAGEFAGFSGPARTHTPMNVWDVRVDSEQSVRLDQPAGWTTLIVVLSGTLTVNDSATLSAKEMATLSTRGAGVRIEASRASRWLLLAGEPIAEQIGRASCRERVYSGV